ncbi:MAG: hypothetical protein JSW58_05490 [Candidatus Latescibacterota bacterium]|nr:MAG: hypothetical protein JSW58_05490 [Candidatus Latescibacterota bacterium]
MKYLTKYIALAAILGMIAFACTETPEPLQAPTPLSEGLLKSAMDGTETLGIPSITIAEGTGIAIGGVGLRFTQADPITIADADIPDGATIEQVLLYWEGFNSSASGDNQVTVNGTHTVTGVQLNNPTLFFTSGGGGPENWSVAYRADITGLGLIDPNVTNNIYVTDYVVNRPNGAGLLVIYSDGSNNEVAGVRDGDDCAYHAFAPTLDTTVPQIFSFAYHEDPRQATLNLMAGSVQVERPNVVRLQYDGGPPVDIVDPFGDIDGEDFDAVEIPLTVPGGATEMSVQCLSMQGSGGMTGDPASLVWICAALEIETIIEPLGCRVTGGCNDGRDTNTSNVYSCGGQAGAPLASPPQPWGNWTHTQHHGPSGDFTFHGGTPSAPEGTEIDWIVCSDPGWCRPARHAPAKQIDFGGVGTFKNMKNSVPASIRSHVIVGESLHWFEVNIDDLGEPGKSGDQEPDPADCDPLGYGRNGGTELGDCDCPDFYRIQIHEGPTDSSPVMYEVYGYIRGGNFQIHPPTGRDRKDQIED